MGLRGLCRVCLLGFWMVFGDGSMAFWGLGRCALRFGVSQFRSSGDGVWG